MVSEEVIKNHVKKIRGLTQFKDKSEAELWEIAKERAQLADPDLQVDFLTDREEQKLAKQFINRYIKDYSIETVSDKNLIKQIVYLEILQIRMQDELNKLDSDDKAVPVRGTEALQKNLDSIIRAKQTLGLTRDKLEASRDSASKAFDLLKEKAKKWREENQGSRTLICPHCSKMVLLKIRTDKYEAIKHPFFKDRILYNKHLFHLYHTQKIMKSDIASILGTSEDYIQWVIDKVERTHNREKSEEAVSEVSKETEST